MENEYSDLKFDENKKFELLLDLAVATLSKVHASVYLVTQALYEENESKIEEFYTLFEKIADEVRLSIIDDLYKNYGWLPPDLLDH